MTEVLVAWRRFLDGLPVDASIPQVILESWARCRAANVDPRPDRVTFRRVGDEDLARRLSENKELLRAARSHLAWLTPLMARVQHAAYVVDRDGVVLETRGNAPDLMESCGLLPGYDWSEATMGTNGAGTALVTGQPVAIIGPMHFCQAWHDATCVAAPIRSPDGRLIGAVDLTTSVADGSPDRLLLVAHLAYAIEQDLAQNRARRHVERLQRLAEAAVTINGTLSLETVLKLITDQAREIIGAHMAVTGQTIGQDWAQMVNAISVSDRYADLRRHDVMPADSGLYSAVCRTNRPVRLTEAELEAHEASRGLGEGKAPRLRGWLAAPLIGGDGRNLGLIHVSDKHEGEFTEEDEAILVRLAKLASVAIENARLYRQAQEAIRASEVFLARASHELRTPLTSLVGMIRLLEKAIAGKLDEPPETLVGIARRNIDAMLALVNNLLDASKLADVGDALQREPVDLAALVYRSVEMVSPQAHEKHVTIRTEVASGLALQADALKLEQLFVNLLANAVKFTAGGAEVVVQAEARERDVIVQVRDTGRGIPPEHLERIFEPFFQVSGHGGRRERGTGLGLAICRQIVTLHGGRIWAESDGPGRGTTFSVVLPGRGADEARAA